MHAYALVAPFINTPINYSLNMHIELNRRELNLVENLLYNLKLLHYVFMRIFIHKLC